LQGRAEGEQGSAFYFRLLEQSGKREIYCFIWLSQ